MTARSPWPPSLPTHSRSTWDCSAPPTAPTCPKLMHLPFSERGIMNPRSFSFRDVAIIMRPLPVPTPAIFALYYPYRLSFLPLPFDSHSRLQGVQQGVSSCCSEPAYTVERPLTSPVLQFFSIFHPQRLPLCSAQLRHFFLTIVHYIHVICRHLISHVYNNCMPS